MRGWLTAAVEGQPRLVLCGGEPGIGKTRLASELAKVAPANYGAGVVWARASEDGGAPPFWLWRQALPESGRLDDAAVAYRRAGPVASWRPPPYFRVPAWAVGSVVAAALGADDDVATLRDRLLASRGRHAVTGAGNASYFGPVELHSGRAAAHLGRWNEAESELTAAADTSRAMGAAAFVVEADCERAAVLARRGGDDAERSRQLA